MSSPTTILEEHGEWMRRLACELVDDPNAAADAVQETCLAVLRSRSRVTPREPKRWLATVLRNFVRQQARSDRRRLAREAAVARAEHLPSTSELVERLAIQRRVADAVEALDEPYRTTILLRFLEGLDTKSIAARTGRNESTVRTHVERGLARLRERLDRQFDGRRPWAIALLGGASFGKPAALTTPTIGLLLMNSKSALAVGALLVVITTATIVLRSGSDPVSAPDDVAASRSTVQERKPDGHETASEAGRRESVAIPPSSATGSPPVEESLRFVEGRVVAVNGQPLAAVAVCSSATGERVVSAADGSVRVTVPDRDSTLRVDAPDWVTVLEALIDPGSSAAHRVPVVVAAPAIAVAGVVVDPMGQALQSVRVRRALPQDLRTRLALVLDHSVEVERTTATDERGRFAFVALDKVAGASITFTCDGYLPASITMPGQPTDTLRVVLERPTAVAGSLLGIVQDERGWPIAGAKVALGSGATETGEDGRFALVLAEGTRARNLHAMKRGLMPATRVLTDDQITPASGATPFLVLELVGTPRSIAGQLSDRSSRPVVGAKVWVTDVQSFGRLGRGEVSIEGYLGGGLGTDELMARFAPSGEPSRPIDSILRETATAMWNWVRTDEKGHFEITGLLDRDYHIAVMDDDSLARTDFGPFHAGARGLDLRIDGFSAFPVVAGRVVSRSGQGLSGLVVRAQADALSMSSDGGRSTMHASGVQTRTDADGRFRLERVGTQGVYLRIEGDAVVPREYGRGVEGGITAVDGRPADDLSILVSKRIHVRIELVDPAEADAIAVENQDGERRNIDAFEGRRRRSAPTIELRDGKSAALALSDDVVRVVLLKNGTVVRRVEVALGDEELTVLHL